MPKPDPRPLFFLNSLAALVGVPMRWGELSTDPEDQVFPKMAKMSFSKASFFLVVCPKLPKIPVCFQFFEGQGNSAQHLFRAGFASFCCTAVPPRSSKAFRTTSTRMVLGRAQCFWTPKRPEISDIKVAEPSPPKF